MIKYRLGCGNGHEFEAWFAAISAFESQQSKGQIACPQCASNAVDRVPMAPALVSKTARTAATRQTPQNHVQAMAGPQSDALQTAVSQLRAMKRALLAQSEDVGAQFAEEARKIHFGESDERSIHGQSTADEARGLADDGIPFGLLPLLPEEHN